MNQKEQYDFNCKDFLKGEVMIINDSVNGKIKSIEINLIEKYSANLK